ncbi:MAG: hypothetical protein ACK5QH_00845 [Rubrivivax sp.]|jgi:hypothetical protein
MNRLEGARLPIIALGLVMSVAACGDLEGQDDKQVIAPSNPPVQAGPSLGEAGPRFYTVATCSADRRPATPAPGTRYEYVYADAEGNLDEGASLSQEITSVDRDLVRYNEVMLLGDRPVSPTERRSLYLGLVPGEGSPRSYEFAPADLARLANLQVGEALSLDGRETSRFDETVTVNGAWHVRFVGCGVTTPAVTGAPREPVRVYRLKSFYRSARPAGDVITTAEIERLISERNGWKVLDREPSGMAILRDVVAPAP